MRQCVERSAPNAQQRMRLSAASCVCNMRLHDQCVCVVRLILRYLQRLRRFLCALRQQGQRTDAKLHVGLVPRRQ